MSNSPQQLHHDEKMLHVSHDVELCHGLFVFSPLPPPERSIEKHCKIDTAYAKEKPDSTDQLLRTFLSKPVVNHYSGTRYSNRVVFKLSISHVILLVTTLCLLEPLLRHWHRLVHWCCGAVRGWVILRLVSRLGTLPRLSSRLRGLRLCWEVGSFIIVLELRHS
jgi:hypothetical protein